LTALLHNGRAAAHPWPDAGQTLLLQAALGDADRAYSAWQQWYRAVEIDPLDADSHRILPLAFRNLERAGLDGADRQELKAVYSRYWVGNQALFREAEIALRALHDHGIETLVLKGLALTVVHYRDGGTRPMNDVDILVRPADARRAFRVLAELGYVPVLDDPFERQLRTRHAIDLHDEAGRQVDLHWYALYQSVGDARLWTDSIGLTVGDVQTRAPCPSDLLLHVCVHGVSGECPGAMRWVADAVTVIRTSGDQLDWQRLVDRAVAQQCTVALHDALAHLSRFVEVPAWVIERLRATPASRAERLAHRAAVRPYPRGNRYAFEWDHYRRWRAARMPGVQPNFAAHLVEYLDLGGYGELAVVLGRKAREIIGLLAGR
jgi:Uncharacterised nucleotidyltransferase